MSILKSLGKALIGLTAIIVFIYSVHFIDILTNGQNHGIK